MMSKQEIADRLLELNRRADNFIQASDWQDLILFLAEAFEIPDEMIYAKEALDPQQNTSTH